MFKKYKTNILERDAVIVHGLDNYSLTDTLECGQCFRYLRLSPNEKGEQNAIGRINPGYVEYMTVVKNKLVFVGQRNNSELIFYNVSDDDFFDTLTHYFALNDDYGEIRADILKNTDSQFLKEAADVAAGIRILKQDPWEALFSFIISQNNNIPRIKKIIGNICSAYGDNLAVGEGISLCPKKCLGFGRGASELDADECRSCGACYSFPSCAAVCDAPELLLSSRPGFRYKYLLDAAQKVKDGVVDIEKIKKENSYKYTVSELMKIKGVGEKVASCASLFAFSNLEAFPIDVWMKRAIDEYFDGNLDPVTLGKYAGVAQQYIFHYIRMIKNGEG